MTSDNASSRSPFDDGRGSRFVVASAEGRRIAPESKEYAMKARDYAERQRASTGTEPGCYADAENGTPAPPGGFHHCGHWRDGFHECCACGKKLDRENHDG